MAFWMGQPNFLNSLESCIKRRHKEKNFSRN